MGTPLSALELPRAASEEIGRWLCEPRYADDRAELEALVSRAASGDADARAELIDAFDGPLPIGTGGRRGACGPGTNRMNTAVLRETAQGLSAAMRAQGVPMRVAVVYDTRRDSQRFGAIVADELAMTGADVLLVDEPRATPLLSFLVRQRGCGAGVVISASHNPAGDNGIKVYGPDGAQVLGGRDRALMEAITEAMAGRRYEADTRGTVERIAGDAVSEVDGPYLAFVRAQGVAGDDVAAARLRAVFTPLHGVGHTSVIPVLRSEGIDVAMVEAQAPDGGEFATVESANPESPAALTLARELAESTGADLVVATDPDADRLGALARDEGGQFAFIDGNRLGVVMIDHIVRHIDPPQRGWVLTTVVSSALVGKIARKAGLDVVDDLLVGFKHHAGMMAEQPQRPLVFATEESHGYLRGDDVHDKDGAIAALLLCEAAALAKRDGRTLFDNLRRCFEEHGYHREKTANIYAYGAVGRDAIQSLVDTWRREPPPAFAGLRVASMLDRRTPRHTGSPTRDLPGNVLVYELEAAGESRCRLVLRPSGTEPKVKVYALASGPAGSDAVIDKIADDVLADARERAQAVMEPMLER